MSEKSISTKKIVFIALLTAIVVILQLMGAFVRFGPFSISLVLMPIVIGAALAGVLAGAWLGLVFGLVVLISGDANPFIAINPAGAVIVVLLKGAFAGASSGFVYNMLSKVRRTAGAIAAAVTCPVINTGTFLLGSYIFFLSALTEWGFDSGFTSVTSYIFTGMIGINFLLELGLNILLCPAIIRLLQYAES